jgi:RND family efflux transporter MFP subunit
MRIINGIIALLITALFITGCGEKEQVEKEPLVRPVKTFTIGGEAGTQRRQFPGKVRASNRVDLSFQVSGQIVELPIKEGQEVEQGDLICKLNDKDFRSNVKAAEASFTKSKANLDRANELIKKDFISRRDYDQIVAQHDIDKSELQKARKALKDTTLIAPFSGVIAKQLVQNFQDIRAKQAVVSFQDPSNLEIVVNIPERLVAARKSDGVTNIYARFDAVPEQQFALQIKEYATQADEKTQTFEYVLSMPQPEGINILPGMTATVHAEKKLADVETQQFGIVIPYAAVFADDSGNSHVWLVDQKTNKVSKRKITTSVLTGTSDVRVTTGLQAGDMIAVTAVNTLREGMEIRPVDKVSF